MTIGKLVGESLDWIDRGNHEAAFAPACAAFIETVKRVYEKDEVDDFHVKKYLQENWAAFTFGMQKAIPMPLNVPFGIKRIFPEFNSLFGIEETIVFLTLKTLLMGKLPDRCEVNFSGVFEIKEEKLFIPDGMVFGLLSLVIFDPVNKDEIISPKSWFNISGFQMFVTELWGRKDLLDRIISYFTDRD